MRLFLALLRNILSLDPRLSLLRTVSPYGLKERILKCPDLLLGPDGFLRGRGEKVWY